MTVAGCATRGVSDTLQGSTAQRLVTYSLEKFIVELADQPELSLTDSSVHLQIHFLEDHPMVNYAARLLAAQLEVVHGMQVRPPDEPADFKIEVFFNSIGTDRDNFGLTIPSLGLVSTTEERIELLALDRFHGITEGHAIVRALTGGLSSVNEGRTTIRRTKRIITRIRRDNVTTPVFEFPVNQLDE